MTGRLIGAGLDALVTIAPVTGFGLRERWPDLYAEGVWRWVGGLNLPTERGARVNASRPLAELISSGDVVRLRMRWLWPLWHPEELEAQPADLDWVSQVEGWIGMRGVGFRRLDGHEFYFKTDLWFTQILAVLSDRGFPVVTGIRKATKQWSSKP
jgi:hypothetical protein